MSLISSMNAIPKEKGFDAKEMIEGDPEMRSEIDRVVEGFGGKPDKPEKVKPESKPKIEEPEQQEVDEEEDDEEEKEGKKEKPQVSAYQERKKKDWEREIERERERADRLEKALLERQQPERKEAPRNEVPDASQDPDGYVRYMLNQGVQRGETAEKTAQAVRQELMLIRAKDELRGMEDDFSKVKPDYREALKFTMDREVSIQRRVNPNASEREIRAQLEFEHLKQVAKLEQAGLNPLETVYQNMLDYGWKPKSDQKDDAEVDEVKNFEAVKRNKAKSASSLTAGGKGGKSASTESPRMSLSKFAKLSKAEKDEIYSNRKRG